MRGKRAALFASFLMASAGCSPSSSEEGKAGGSDAAGSDAEWGATDCVAPAGGEEVGLDLFVPEGEGPFPIVVVAHGFKRSRARMAGWGRALADAGYVVAVPDLPGGFGIDHELNGKILSDLLDWLAAASHPSLRSRVDPTRRALVGYSAGGLAAILAAPEQPELDLVVLLDGVDRAGLGASKAGAIEAPVVALTAEPDDCNANGNGLAMMEAAQGATEHTHVEGATHCDPEWPSDTLCSAFCGAPAEERQRAFRTKVMEAFERHVASETQPPSNSATND